MATHDYIISNASGAAVRADLNNALAAIVTNNSSATAPTTTYAYQWWADTGSSPTVMKLRNAANSAWITLFQLDGEWSLIPFENGTAAAPSIYFKDSGTDTGIYSPGADQVAITTGGTARLYVGSTGSVGIGTTPESIFHVKVATNENIRFTGGSGDTRIACFNDATSATTQLSIQGSPLLFRSTGGLEAARISSSGWFKASNTGTYTYSQSMHEVRSNANDFVLTATNSNASPTGIQIYHITDVNGTGNEFLYCYAGNTLRASIRSNGGLANFSANNANLSDRNAKKDISPAAGTWDCIKEWEIVNYRYKDQPDDSDLNLGVIAQQVAESCPEVITVFQEAKGATETEPAQEERLGVKEQQMYWMAIKALQEAQVRIEILEAKVAALESA